MPRSASGRWSFAAALEQAGFKRYLEKLRSAQTNIYAILDFMILQKSHIAPSMMNLAPLSMPTQPV